MPGHEPETERSTNLELTTLAIAAAASAAAAFATSQVWPAGTLWSAAATPVIVALVKEALSKPAAAVQSVRTRTTAREESEVRVYVRRRRRWRLAAITGVIAFVVVALLYTVPELVTGKSLGRGGDNRTTLFGGEPRGTAIETRDDRSNDVEATPTPEATPQATPTPETAETPEPTPTPEATGTATAEPVPTP